MPDTISATIPPGSMPRSDGESSASRELRRLNELLTKPKEEKREGLADWRGSEARPDQLAPDGDWTTWLMLGGRGAGKTRAGAEWIRERVLSSNAMAGTGGEVERIALVGETIADVREVMVQGESGLLSLDWGRGFK